MSAREARGESCEGAHLVVLVVAPDKDVATVGRTVSVRDGVVLRIECRYVSLRLSDNPRRNAGQSAALWSSRDETERTRTTATCPSPAWTSLMPTNSTLFVRSFPGGSCNSACISSFA